MSLSGCRGRRAELDRLCVEREPELFSKILRDQVHRAGIEECLERTLCH